MPPSFVQQLQSTTVSQGSQVRLDIRVTGIPTPLVKFYREGAEIQSSTDFRIIQEGDLHSLLIAEAFPEDSGTYSVTASSSSGRATCTAELLVQGEHWKGQTRQETVSICLMLIPICSGEEAIPAKKTKTLISAAHVSQTHQTEVDQVGHTSNHRFLWIIRFSCKTHSSLLAAGVLTLRGWRPTSILLSWWRSKWMRQNWLTKLPQEFFQNPHPSPPPHWWPR